MIGIWSRHRQAARTARNRLEAAQRHEGECRGQLGRRAAEAIHDVHNLFWVALTGAAWAARFKYKDEDDRRGPLTELLASIVVIWRWRHFKDRAVSAFKGNYPVAIEQSDSA